MKKIKLHPHYSNAEVKKFNEILDRQIEETAARVSSDKLELRELTENVSDLADRASYLEIKTTISSRLAKLTSKLEVLQSRKIHLNNQTGLFGRCIKSRSYIPADILMRNITQAIMPEKDTSRA